MNAAAQTKSTPDVRGSWRQDEPMSRHTTWRCGGPADQFFAPADREDLIGFIRQCGRDLDILWLGLGSNLLIRDGGVAQTVIATAGGLDHFTWERPECLYAECGVTCARLAREAAAHDRAGLEFLAGIPGTLGGALRMNAGALGSETWQFVSAVETIDRRGVVRRQERAEFVPRYRGVSGPQEWFLGAWFELPGAAAGEGPQRIRQVLAQRSATQPTGKATCGSVFKNPEGDYAGRLIESCGLKGLQVGGAEVSSVHANFIVNDGNATAHDIETLIVRVRELVAARTGVVLETEVQIIGRPAAAAEARP